MGATAVYATVVYAHEHTRVSHTVDTDDPADLPALWAELESDPFVTVHYATIGAVRIHDQDRLFDYLSQEGLV
jgi:hypothetical protein